MVAKKRSWSGVVNGFGLTTLMSGGGGLVAPGKNKQIRNVNHQIDHNKAEDEEENKSQIDRASFSRIKDTRSQLYIIVPERGSHGKSGEV